MPAPILILATRPSPPHSVCRPATSRQPTRPTTRAPSRWLPMMSMAMCSKRQTMQATATSADIGSMPTACAADGPTVHSSSSTTRWAVSASGRCLSPRRARPRVSPACATRSTLSSNIRASRLWWPSPTPPRTGCRMRRRSARPVPFWPMTPMPLSTESRDATSSGSSMPTWRQARRHGRQRGTSSRRPWTPSDRVSPWSVPALMS